MNSDDSDFYKDDLSNIDRYYDGCVNCCAKFDVCTLEILNEFVAKQEVAHLKDKKVFVKFCNKYHIEIKEYEFG